MKAQAFLDMAANRSTRDQSQFLNGLIHRKAFSWTRVFEDLEQVMPTNLHVVSLRPEFNEQNQMQLDMKVVGDNRRSRRTGPSHGRLEAFPAARNWCRRARLRETGSAITRSIFAIYVPDVAGRGVGKVMPDLSKFTAQVERSPSGRCWPPT